MPEAAPLIDPIKSVHAPLKEVDSTPSFTPLI